MDNSFNPNWFGACPACKSAYRGANGYCQPCMNAYTRVRRWVGKDLTHKITSAREWRRAYKASIVAEKGGKCMRCGFVGDTEAKRAALHFHHRGRVYDFRMSSSGTRSRSAVEAELEKCDLLCSNCHIVEHFAEKPEIAGRKRKPIDARTQYFIDKLEKERAKAA